MDPDVPLLIPDVNPDHNALIRIQQTRRGGSGFIVTNPNCSATHPVCALKPLHDAFGLKTVNVVTMQALSGAGYPGVASLDILDNVIPYIGGEEEKIESEPRKLLRTLSGDRIIPADFKVSVDGQPRRIVSVEQIGRATPAAAAPAASTAPRLVSTNASAPAGQLVMIVVDENSLRTGSRSAIQAAQGLLDSLPGSDLVGLAVIPAGPNVPFTRE